MTSLTDTGYAQAKLPLGVGSLIGDSFSILFRKFLTVMVLSSGPLIIGLAISGLLVGWGMTLQAGEIDPLELEQAFGGSSFWAKWGLSMVVQMAIYGITTALLVQLAYDAKLDRSRSIGQYFGPALRSAFPIVILMIATMFLVTLGGLALLIGALWVYAVFSVTTPAIVIERAGFRGMGRSATLTKDYRWPIIGMLILVFLLTFALSFVMQFIVGLIVVPFGESGVGIAISVVVMALLQSITLGLGSITAALVFARLKEIKEGVSVDQLAAVFE